VSKSKSKGRGIRQPDQLSAMTARACDIAVSEMTGFPLEDICGYVLVVLRHVPPGHELSILQGPRGLVDDQWACAVLDKATVNLRGTP